MELAGACVAVTGATGFLGRYIVAALRARGARVIGVVRNPARVPALARMGVELRRADLAERERLAEAFAGADAVVSNAALYALRYRRWEDYQRANVQGTRNVFEALVAAGIRRVVHVSSVAVYGLGARGVVTEDHPQLTETTRRTPINAYPVSKALSEQLAWALAREHDLALSTVRPCTIYGAFDPNFMPIFRRLVSLPVTVMPAFLRMGFVYAGDVAEAIALVLERPGSIGRAYNTTGERETVWELADAWKAAGGRRAFLMLPLPLPFTMRFDSSRARSELGWRSRPLAEGLRETFALEASG
jgi:nucleoside-diphosphate-sugar epimerase